MRRDDWTTPQALFDFLDERFGFGLDAAATEQNTKCPYFYNEVMDSLKQPWDKKAGPIFCNPPYSKAGEFALHALEQIKKHGGSTAILLPVRSDRLWFQKVLNDPITRVCWITGRLHFGGSDKSAFMYNVIFYWSFKQLLPSHIQAGQFNLGGRGDAKS